MTNELESLRGIGPVTIDRLSMVGIDSVDKLEELGALGAYLLLKDAFPKWASLNALWGLQAALMDIDWRELPEELKQQLRIEVENSG